MFQWQITLIALLTWNAIAFGQAESRARQYLRLLDRGISHSEEQLPSTSASAAEAAKRLIAGGKIWVVGPRDDFPIEAYVRAGGLMCVKLLQQNIPAAGDTVLYGTGGAISGADLARLVEWRKAGVYVVAFAAGSSDAKDGAADILIDNGSSPGLKVSENGKEKLCPIDTVLNAANLWAWTGEMAAACTRMAKMPTFYKSVLRPGGRERNAKYANNTFHDDFTIAPIAAGVLGRKYLHQLHTYLAVVESQGDKIAKVAQWWHEVKVNHTFVLTLGHLFPSNLQDSRSPLRPIKSVGEQDPPLQGQDDPDRLVLFIGYQEAPNKLVQNVAMSGSRLVYISVRSADSPPGAGERIVHLKPGWPIEDACVVVEKYDVPILPASGVINAAIYWAIVAEACNPLGGPLSRP